MQKEELLKMLQDAGLDDEAIKALLHDLLADLEGNTEGDVAPEAPVESDDDKMNRIFGL